MTINYLTKGSNMYDCNTRKIGEVFVDAGIVMIGDPCYRYNNKAAEANDWEAFCAALGNHRDPAEPLGEGLGIVVPTTHGDGTYPVIGLYRGHTLVGLTILFDEDEVDDDDDQIDDEDEEV